MTGRTGTGPWGRGEWESEGCPPPGRPPVPRWGVCAARGPPPARDEENPPPGRASGGELRGTARGCALRLIPATVPAPGLPGLGEALGAGSRRVFGRGAWRWRAGAGEAARWRPGEEWPRLRNSVPGLRPEVDSRGAKRRPQGVASASRPLSGKVTSAWRPVQAPWASLSGGGLLHQPSDPLHGRRVETGQSAHLDVEPPLLDSLEQFLAFQSQFFRQLVNTRGQRQLLPEPTPDGRGNHDRWWAYSMIWVCFRRDRTPRVRGSRLEDV